MISIITVAYNSENTIEDTIKSVLNQSYQNIDYCIVDGCSTDKTISIIKKYEPFFYGKMRWISEPDKGIYDAMNKGIMMARGDYVGFLNSDDFYSSNNVLQELSNKLNEAKVDAVYADVCYVSPHNTKKTKRYYSSRIFRPFLMRLGFIPAHPTFYCVKEVYNKYGLFSKEYRIAADFEWLLRVIFIHRIKTKYLPLNCVTMRIGGASSSGLHSRKIIMKEQIKALRKHHIYTNVFILSFRYVYKLFEYLWIKH